MYPCTDPRVISIGINVILKYAMKFVVFFHRKPISKENTSNRIEHLPVVGGLVSPMLDDFGPGT